MVDNHKIKQVAVLMGRAAKASKVILFGSHARGDTDENSDVDLMIIAKSNLPRFKRSRELYKLMRPYPFAMDLVVYTPEEIERGMRSPVSFVSTVLREGKTLYVRRDKNSETMDKDAENLRDSLAILMPYAVEIRYPDDWYLPTEEDALEAREAAAQVLKWLRKALPQIF